MQIFRRVDVEITSCLLGEANILIEVEWELQVMLTRSDPLLPPIPLLGLLLEDPVEVRLFQAARSTDEHL